MTFWTRAERCFVIGEIGVNHNGDVDMARRLIDVAVSAGADAVKFQTFRAEALTTRSAAKAAYQVRNEKRADESQLEMLRRLEFPAASLAACRDHCTASGIAFLSTPFDEESAALLADLDVAGFKVSSGDLTNLPFLESLSAYGRPIIVSTGMGSMTEVAAAVDAVGDRAALALLHCVSNYPAVPEDCNLNAIPAMAKAFGLDVGWSDHTLGAVTSVAAIALGAKIIEKHFTLDRELPGPDHKASLEPEAFAAFVTSLREAEAALGDGVKKRRPSEVDTASVARKSLVAARFIPEGSTIEADMIARKRPGIGLSPSLASAFVGRRAGRDVEADALLSWDDLT